MKKKKSFLLNRPQKTHFIKYLINKNMCEVSRFDSTHVQRSGGDTGTDDHTITRRHVQIFSRRTVWHDGFRNTLSK